MTEYRGVIDKETGETFVLKDEVMLQPMRSQAIINHSPDGFSWGYNGSGPAQLALALLLEETDKEVAMDLYQAFKSDIISKLPMDQEWQMDSSVIKTWLEFQTVPERVCED